MAKRSGNTRTSGASSGSPGEESGRWGMGYSLEEENRILNSISNGGWVELPPSFSELNGEQRELLLMMSGFSGLTEEDNASLYFPIEKKEFVSMLTEDLGNISSGYKIDDSVSWAIGYKDGTTKYLSEMDNDFDGIKLTSNQSFSKQKSIVSKALKDAAFILRSDGYSEPTYRTSKGGLTMLKKYGGFEEWKNGRGEKRRDYIQDDWI